MNQGYPKDEKLKSRKSIDRLFSEGKSIARYPLRLVYQPTDQATTQIGVSVSKKYFKKAVDRNYIKRILRECYRKNKQILPEQPYSLMLLYQSKEIPEYSEIEKKTIHLFNKLSEMQNADFVTQK